MLGALQQRCAEAYEEKLIPAVLVSFLYQKQAVVAFTPFSARWVRNVDFLSCFGDPSPVETFRAFPSGGLNTKSSSHVSEGPVSISTDQYKEKRQQDSELSLSTV